MQKGVYKMSTIEMIAAMQSRRKKNKFLEKREQ